jgi:hypothetical protein
MPTIPPSHGSSAPRLAARQTGRARDGGLAFAAGLALFASACGAEATAPERIPIGAPDRAPSEVVSRAELSDRERALPGSLPRLDNGDGTWSFALPEGFDRDLEVRGESVTWRYERQERFSNRPLPPTSIRHHVVRPERPELPEEQLARLRRLDAHGRIWRVASIDAARWAKLRAPEEAELEDERPADRAAPRPLEPELPVGTVVPWKPMSWSHANCEGSALEKEVHLWEGESRVAKIGALTDRQSAAVQITNGSSNSLCSGVLLSQDEVLTAAHCVSDDSNSRVPPSTVSVCRADTGECRTGSDIDFSDSYTGGNAHAVFTDFDDDWAIIELSGAWTTTAKNMVMSAALDDTIGSLTGVHNLGFPMFAPTCGGAYGDTLHHNHEMEPVASITTKLLKLKIDGSPGQSGGPVYYCPDGDDDECAAGDSGYVLAVFAGWQPLTNRYVGPKVPHFRAAAVVFTSD